MRIKTKDEIAAMREGGRMLALVLQKVKNEMKAGMSTKDLDDMAADEVKKLGGRPAFLNHEGFAGVLCTSINQEIVHGLPSKKKILKDGDVIGDGSQPGMAAEQHVGTVAKRDVFFLHDNIADALGRNCRIDRDGRTADSARSASPRW